MSNDPENISKNKRTCVNGTSFKESPIRGVIMKSGKRKKEGENTAN